MIVKCPPPTLKVITMNSGSPCSKVLWDQYTDSSEKIMRQRCLSVKKIKKQYDIAALGVDFLSFRVFHIALHNSFSAIARITGTLNKSARIRKALKFLSNDNVIGNFKRK